MLSKWTLQVWLRGVINELEGILQLTVHHNLYWQTNITKFKLLHRDETRMPTLSFTIFMDHDLVWTQSFWLWSDFYFSKDDSEVLPLEQRLQGLWAMLIHARLCFCINTRGHCRTLFVFFSTNVTIGPKNQDFSWTRFLGGQFFHFLNFVFRFETFCALNQTGFDLRCVEILIQDPQTELGHFLMNFVFRTGTFCALILSMLCLHLE